MKHIVALVAVLVTVVSTEAYAQTFFEYQYIRRGGLATPVIDGQVVIPGEHVDAFAWFLANDGWGEALLGISKNVRPWLWVGFAAGVETDDNPFRVNPNIWVGNGRVSTFFSYEYGGSGYWYKSVTQAWVHPRLAFGLHSQRFVGTGPSVRGKIGGGFEPWAMYAPKTKRGIIALAKTF